MKLQNSSISRSCWPGVTTVFLFLVLALPSAADSVRIARLIEGVRQDASQLNEQASRWVRLTLDANAQWSDYDDQWSLIKPLEEDLGPKLTELGQVREELTPSQRQGLQLSWAIYGRIQANVDALGELLVAPGITRNHPGFGNAARSLAQQARLLAQTL